MVLNYQYFKFEKQKDLFNKKPCWFCYSLKKDIFFGVVQYEKKLKYTFISETTIVRDGVLLENVSIMQDQIFLEDMLYFIRQLNRNEK